MRGETELSGNPGKLSGRYCVTPSRCGAGEEERQAKKLRRAEDLHRPILRQETRPIPRQRGSAGCDAAGQVVQAGVGLASSRRRWRKKGTRKFRSRAIGGPLRKQGREWHCGKAGKAGATVCWRGRAWGAGAAVSGGCSRTGHAPGPRFLPLVRRAGVEPAGGEDRPPRFPFAAYSEGRRLPSIPQVFRTPVRRRTTLSQWSGVPLTIVV